MRLLPEEPGIRRMALVTLVNTTGNGIFFTLSALYFTRIVGFSVVEVGTGLSIAAGAGLFAGIPIGHLADRRGPREVLVACVVLVGLAAAVYLQVTQWWQFVLVAAVISVLERGSSAVRTALIAGLVSGARRSTARAYLRSVTNLGIALGSGLAAIALALDTREAYVVVMYANVATYWLAAGLMLAVPHVAPHAATPGRGMLLALRDLPFVAVAVTSGLLSMHYLILDIAIPLWVVNHTEAPPAMVAVLIVLNTATLVVVQVAVARRVVTLERAVGATVLSGLLFLAACAVFGLSGDAATTGAILLLLLGGVLHVVGEVTQAAGSFVFGFELPPQDAMGQYQGVWGMALGIGSFAGPTVIALLPLALGTPGWLALGGVLLAAALAHRPAVAWASRPRPSGTEGGAPAGMGTPHHHQ